MLLRRRFCTQQSAPIKGNILTFTAEQANSTIALAKNGSPAAISLEYSTNGGRTWEAYTVGDVITLTNIGDSVKFRGNNTKFANGISNYHKFVMTGQISSSGDITSLLNNVGGDVSLTGKNYCFCKLFSDCTSLTNAPKLPSMTLANNCYLYMFNNCTSLTTAPALSATTLNQDCYRFMFKGCTSLTAAPTLPATTSASGCYSSMFQNCTSLVTAPALPSMALTDFCYEGMFAGCTSLETAPELPAMTLASCCYRSMFESCTLLVTAPNLPSTTLASDCYEYMFQNCTSLTTAPELPATTLVDWCYRRMFNGCSNLSYIKAMFTTLLSTMNTYTYEWVNGVALMGTFVKNSAATWTDTGVNGIPEGWTVETASE